MTHTSSTALFFFLFLLESAWVGGVRDSTHTAHNSTRWLITCNRTSMKPYNNHSPSYSLLLPKCKRKKGEIISIQIVLWLAPCVWCHIFPKVETSTVGQWETTLITPPLRWLHLSVGNRYMRKYYHWGVHWLQTCGYMLFNTGIHTSSLGRQSWVSSEVKNIYGMSWLEPATVSWRTSTLTSRPNPP